VKDAGNVHRRILSIYGAGKLLSGVARHTSFGCDRKLLA
jgi:hypothetical protein